MTTYLLVVHLLGLALAVGGAMVKLALLPWCGSDPARIAAYVRVANAITRMIFHEVGSQAALVLA